MALVDARGFNLGADITGEARGFTQLLSQGQTVQGREMALQQQRVQLEREAQVRQALSGGAQMQPQTQQEQMRAEQTAGLGGALAQAEQPQPIMTFEEKKRMARDIDPAIANKILKEGGLDDASKRAEASRFASDLENTPFELRGEKIEARIQNLTSLGRNPSDTAQLRDLTEEQQNQALLGVQLADLNTQQRFGVKAAERRGVGMSAAEREFEALIKDLPEAEKERARKIKLGLDPRAVGSAIQTITAEGTAEEVGETSAIIKQREKFGELTGASRAKTIDKGVERIQNIDKSIRNFDKAIAAIDKGASTGVMQRFAPTVRAATAELEQIQNLLALDVLNSATFGALSEKELEVVKDTAMPDKLSPPKLREWFELRKSGEQKLRAYFKEQIDHLDQGGTVSSFLRMKDRETSGGEGAAQPTTTQTTQPATQRIRFDAQGNII